MKTGRTTEKSSETPQQGKVTMNISRIRKSVVNAQGTCKASLPSCVGRVQGEGALKQTLPVWKNAL